MAKILVIGVQRSDVVNISSISFLGFLVGSNREVVDEEDVELESLGPNLIAHEILGYRMEHG